MSKVQNKYAIISVSDKSNIEDIARSLVDLGYIILSTGGPAKYLTSMSIPNVSVSDFTEFEEILGGRVKTLHPKIFGGILNRRSNKSDNDVIIKYNIPNIDLVIVDLYPFEKTVTSDASEQEILMMGLRLNEGVELNKLQHTTFFVLYIGLTLHT